MGNISVFHTVQDFFATPSSNEFKLLKDKFFRQVLRWKKLLSIEIWGILKDVCSFTDRIKTVRNKIMMKD